MIEISQGKYGKYYIDNVEHIIKNYDIDAILVTNGDFYEYSFDSLCEAEYLKYMNSRGVTAFEWPKSGLAVNIDDSSISNWQNYEMEKFYSNLKSRVVNYEVELWISAKTDEKDPNTLSKKYGQDLTMLNRYATRVVVNAPVQVQDAPERNNNYAELLNEEGITYVLDMPLTKGASSYLTTEEFETIAQRSIDGETKSLIISSNYLVDEPMWDSVLKMSLYKEIEGIEDAQLTNLYSLGRYDILRERVEEIKKLRREEILTIRTGSKNKINSLESLVSDIEKKVANAKSLNLDTSQINDKLEFGRREYSLARTSFIEGRYEESFTRADNAQIVLNQVNYALQSDTDTIYSSRMYIGFTIVIIFVIFLFLVYYSIK